MTPNPITRMCLNVCEYNYNQRAEQSTLQQLEKEVIVWRYKMSLAVPRESDCLVVVKIRLRRFLVEAGGQN